VNQQDAGGHVQAAQEIARKRAAQHRAAFGRKDVEGRLSDQQSATQKRQARSVRQNAVAEYGREERQLEELDQRVQA